MIDVHSCVHMCRPLYLPLAVSHQDIKNLSLLGGESVHRSLENLHSTLDRLRRRVNAKPSGGLDGDDDDDAAGFESEGVRLVREGRSARLADAQSAVDSRRDQVSGR